MKYYCKICGTEYNFKNDSYLISCRARTPDMMMDDDSCDGTLELIPDYETPEQYEKRTGKAFSNNGLVWVRFRDRAEDSFVKTHDKRFYWLEYRFAQTHSFRANNLIVIADPPVPPPDDWRPE